MTKKLERMIDRAVDDSYTFIQATDFEVLHEEGDENHVMIAVKDSESKTIMGSRLHIKDAQHIFSKILTWDKAIQ